MVLCASADGGDAEEVEEAEELCACMQLLTSRDMEAWVAAAAETEAATSPTPPGSRVPAEGGTVAKNTALNPKNYSPDVATGPTPSLIPRSLLHLPPSLVLYDIVLATTLRGNHQGGLAWERENCALVYKVAVG